MRHVARAARDVPRSSRSDEALNFSQQTSSDCLPLPCTRRARDIRLKLQNRPDLAKRMECVRLAAAFERTLANRTERIADAKGVTHTSPGQRPGSRHQKNPER